MEGDASDGIVTGVIEADSFTVCGSLIAGCCNAGGCCVSRTDSDYVIAMLDSEQCKWCDLASRDAEESDFDHVRTLAYLRVIFELSLADTARLLELITELTSTQSTQTQANGIPFTATQPYCTVENVRHISSRALKLLRGFDCDFVWGHNLTFNTRVHSAGSAEPCDSVNSE